MYNNKLGEFIIIISSFLFYIKESENTRNPRCEIRVPFLHVMVQGVNKEFIFNKESEIEFYLKLIFENKDNFDIEIIAYCIMNNHAHILIYTDDMKKLGKFMHKVNLIYAQKYNDDKNRCGGLFRNRYKSEQIYNIKYLTNCIMYIHNNPVKAGIVMKCDEYKYSSYREYINNCGVASCKQIKEIYGENCNFEKLFNDTIDRRFMDIDQSSDYEFYIKCGIWEFCKTNKIRLYDLVSQRENVSKLILFLHKDCNIKYGEIGSYLGISKGCMNYLIKNSKVGR